MEEQIVLPGEISSDYGICVRTGDFVKVVKSEDAIRGVYTYNNKDDIDKLTL